MDQPLGIDLRPRGVGLFPAPSATLILRRFSRSFNFVSSTPTQRKIKRTEIARKENTQTEFSPALARLGSFLLKEK